jgi:HEAT repeats
MSQNYYLCGSCGRGYNGYDVPEDWGWCSRCNCSICLNCIAHNDLVPEREQDGTIAPFHDPNDDQYRESIKWQHCPLCTDRSITDDELWYHVEKKHGFSKRDAEAEITRPKSSGVLKEAVSRRILKLITKVLETDSIPELIGKLEDVHHDVRGAAAMVLGSMGKKAEPAVPSILKALQDADYFVRTQAALAVIQIQPDRIFSDASLVNVFSDALSSNEKGDRCDGACGLLRMNAHVEQAVTLLIQEISDIENPYDVGVQLGRNALAAINPETLDARVKPLLEAASNGFEFFDDEEVQAIAAELATQLQMKLGDH